MKTLLRLPRPVVVTLLSGFLACLAAAQQPPGPGDGPTDFPPGPGGPGGMGGPGGGGVRPETKLVQQFDQNGDGRLNAAERKAAREQLAKDNASGSRRGGPGRMGPRAQASVAATPGPKVSPSDVASHTEVPFYDPKTVRTVFLQFENPDWERELSDFHDTDVLVPAQVTVDGKIYADVGVHFRGMSSYSMVGEGRKRSLNLTLDYVHDGQNVGGYRTLNLLNSHEDPSFLRAVLFYDIAREYLPAPKANFVQVVINGEAWGLYVNVEQFNKDFVKEWYGSKKGARWKVPGSPGGRGSLAYLGTNVDEYRKIYEIKSKDDAESWKALIELCRILNEIPADQLEAALEPVLDVDGALRFLALDNALINNDGYWIRTSDYSIYRDEKGRFHILPQDANESFSRPGGPGFSGGPGGGPAFGRRPRGGDTAGAGPRREGAGPVPGAPAGGFPAGGRAGVAIQGVELDPLVAASDASKPLISKLLAVPSLKARYLAYVREIADRHLDWKNLGPRAEAYHNLIAPAVAADTRKLDSTESFNKSLTEDDGRTLALKNFADQRRAYLLKVTPASAASK